MVRYSQGRVLALDFGRSGVCLQRELADGRRLSPWAEDLLAFWRGDTVSEGGGRSMTAAVDRRRREVNNPVLGLPAAQALAELDPDARNALAAVLADLSADAAGRAQRSWAHNKGVMAAYWKAVSVYARHIRRVLRPAP